MHSFDVFSGRFVDDGDSLPEIHVLLGLSIMLLGLLRVPWRAATPLPPWAESLGSGERRLEFALEKVLLALLFVVPGTGLLLIAAGHDWLPLHVTAQVLFLVVIALHVGLVLKHTVVYRRAHLRRMLLCRRVSVGDCDKREGAGRPVRPVRAEVRCCANGGNAAAAANWTSPWTPGFPPDT